MKMNMSLKAVSSFAGKKIVLFSLILVLGFFPVLVAAQSQANPCTTSTVQNNPTQRAQALPKCVNQIYVWSLAIGALLALLMCIVGGYYYMTSGGNAEQASKGKEYITGSLIGLLILFTAYLLLRQINPDLVNFNVNSLNGINTQPRQ
ncbi:MAG: hypothetical protein KW804_01775 [Candidatus Doudnabacteria bacterium]|nr:hypothetical protein [Candidatus Doudnabacteria bacterium]